MKEEITDHTIFMRRCLDLAALGAGNVAPNPMVGAVLVYNGKIIGEGYHQRYGEAHAEVNAINNAIEKGFAAAVSKSVIYVSLEPCAHFGKTPPCADLIIRYKIPKVVIGCRDPFKEVNGKGIEKLQAAGIEVVSGIMENECMEINRRFFTFHTKHRPYIILKWAQTENREIASLGTERLLITNEKTNRLVHKWRGEEAGILIGTNTALADNPELTTRLWPGNSPVRLVIDMNLRLPSSLKIFNSNTKTIVFNKIKHEQDGNILFYQITDDVSVVQQVVNALYHLKIQSLIVEGGALLLQSFIEENLWDEARVITNTKMKIENGLPAPQLVNAAESSADESTGDLINIFKPVS